MVVDSLNHHKYEGKLEKVFRRGEIKQLGVIIGVITGSFIGQINLAWPWLLSSIFFMILAVVTIFIFREDYFVKPEKTKFSFTPIKKIIYDSFRYGLKNRNLMSMIIFSAIIAFIIQAVNMYWPIVFQQDFSVPTKFMGVIFALIVIFSYGGAQLSDFWQRKIGCHKNAIFFSQIITVLGIFFCVFSFKLPIFLVFFLVHEFGRGLVSPLKRAYVNNHIQDKNRSTILSFESMVVKGGAALGLLFGGLIANSFSIMTSWLFSSIILLMTIFIFWFNNREKK